MVIRRTCSAVMMLLCALPALALDPAITSTVPQDREFFISGSSAQAGVVELFLRNDFCQAGTFNRYNDSASTPGSLWQAYSCTTMNAFPVPFALRGQNVIVHKRNKGGSIWGSHPIANNGFVEYMNIRNGRASGNCTAISGTSPVQYSCGVSATLAQRGDPRHSTDSDECAYDTAAPVNPASTGANYTPAGGVDTTDDYARDTLCRRSSGGISDVEHELFSGTNLPASPSTFTALNTAQLAALNRLPWIGVVFGVAVSRNAYNALQTLQGLATTDATDFTESQQPSLSRSQVTALLRQGGVASWNSVLNGINISGLTPGANELGICRRESGSGTQAASNLFFLGTECDVNAPFPAGAGDSDFFSYMVVEGASTSHSLSCLGSASDSGVNFGGIGVVSIENQPLVSASSGAGSWRFVKLDGVAPTLANAVIGKYPFWFEARFAFNSGMATGAERDFVQSWLREERSPMRIQSASVRGVAALPAASDWDNGTNNNPFPGTVVGTNVNPGSPVMGSSRQNWSSCGVLINAADDPPAPDRAM